MIRTQLGNLSDKLDVGAVAVPAALICKYLGVAYIYCIYMYVILVLIAAPTSSMRWLGNEG